MTGRPRARSRAALLIVVAALLVLFVGVTNAPTNVVSGAMPEWTRSLGRGLLPQGWAFFTRDPQGPFYYGFLITQEGLLTETPVERSMGGLDRSPRMNAELLSSAAKSVNEWTPCQVDTPFDCASAESIDSTVEVEYPDHLLCGNYVLVRHTPTPWSWIDLVDKPKLEVAGVTAKC